MEFYDIVLFWVLWFEFLWLALYGWFFFYLFQDGFPPSGWEGPEVVFYQGFDGSYGLILMEGKPTCQLCPFGIWKGSKVKFKIRNP